MKLVAIHQPNFFPWLGYFNKLHRADVFVIMDNVQFQKSGAGTWSNRVKILVNGVEKWMSMPVMRDFEGTRTYHEMRISGQGNWRKKMLRTLQTSYGRAPCFQDVMPVLDALVSNPTGELVAFNLRVIRTIASGLGLDVSKLRLGSALDVRSKSTELLIDIVKAVDGTAYLAGGDAGKYQQDHRFAEEGVELVDQTFTHPEYCQFNTESFVPGLSVVDALMNCGFDGVRSLVTGRG